VTHAPARIKFCGITTLDDAQRAVDAGAWAVGVILWDGSPRRCPLPVAEQIAGRLRRTVEVCGVFVNATLDEIAATVDGVGLTMVQLHGDEGPSFCLEVARRTGAKVIKAGRINAKADMADMERYHTDFHLLDAYRAGVPGGTGETFDWDLVQLRRTTIPFILSGGLTPDNVGDAIVATSPFAVDTASGTESAPGVKDPQKLLAFAAAVHAAAPPEPEPDPAPAADEAVTP
jgi:phosphoribosylanthranilate isomerase